MSKRESLLRDPKASHVVVDFVELFFDLVYVFAVTQLSHFLLDHLGPTGLVQAVVLFGAVWWAWIYTAWATNWLDPRRVAVRLAIFAVMLASLVMSASIPDAFGARGLWFALAYVAIQVLRSAWLAYIMWCERPKLSLGLIRITIWFVVTTPLWIGGGLADPSLRMMLWGLALAIEYCGPALQFRVPFFGRSHTQDYAVSGSHMAERSALLIIVALGEGVLVTGATFAQLDWSVPTIAAAMVAFLGSAAAWWVYFDIGMRRGSDRIEHDEDSGRIARDSYTYGHIPIVAGIVIAAVGDEMLMSHSTGHSSNAFLFAMLGGNALFLAGTMLFKRMTSGQRFWPLSHLVGLILFAICAMVSIATHPIPIVVGTMVVVILVTVAVWEWGSFHGGWTERGIGVPRFLRAYVDWRRRGG